MASPPSALAETLEALAPDPFQEAFGPDPVDSNEKRGDKSVFFQYRECYGIIAVIPVIKCDRHIPFVDIGRIRSTVQVFNQKTLKAIF